MSKLLALDLSTNVGWALFGERGTVPSFGTLRLSGDLNGKLGRFDVWLETGGADMKPDAIAWERPLIVRTDTVDKLELLYGLVGIAHAAAYRMKLPHTEVTVQEAKLALTGKGLAKKHEMVAAAMNDMNWKVATEHEADAGAVGLVAYDRIWPRRAA